MSKALVLAVWDRILPPSEKSILTAFAWNADKSGRAWPGIHTVADRSGYKARHVHNIITKLKQKGILKAERRLGQAHGFVTEYSIDLSGVPLLTTRKSAKFAQLGAAKSANTADLSLQSAGRTVQSEAGSVQSTTSKSALASAEEQYEFRRRIVKTELPGSPPEPDEQQATTKVCLELSLAGNENRMLVCDSVRSCVHTLALSPREAADTLVERWADYERLDIPYKKGKVKFFKEGVWRNPESWAKPNGATREKSKNEQRLERSLAAIENA